MEDYRIFEIEYDAKVELVSTHNEFMINNPLLKVARRSISEGIFESKLAEEANCPMWNGNLYRLYYDNDNYIYIHCEDEYAYFGTDIIRN